MSTENADGYWHKSSYSDGRGGDCVEVAEGVTTRVRDTQNRDKGNVSVPAPEWSVFVRTLRP